jgi:hypothetical protein
MSASRLIFFIFLIQPVPTQTTTSLTRSISEGLSMSEYDRPIQVHEILCDDPNLKHFLL